MRRTKNVWFPSLLQLMFALVRVVCANVFGVFLVNSHLPLHDEYPRQIVLKKALAYDGCFLCQVLYLGG